MFASGLDAANMNQGIYGVANLETMTLEQQLLETLHVLPPEQQAEVVDFAAFLKRRLDNARQPPGGGAGAAADAGWSRTCGMERRDL
jgi:hypothetical protein